MLQELFNSALQAIALASSDGTYPHISDNIIKVYGANFGTLLCLFFEQLLTDHLLIFRNRFARL